jgi:hypothetical protein
MTAPEVVKRIKEHAFKASMKAELPEPFCITIEEMCDIWTWLEQETWMCVGVPLRLKRPYA